MFLFLENGCWHNVFKIGLELLKFVIYSYVLMPNVSSWLNSSVI